MQPFTISCLTCGTKLKVSDESLIGEILMCAKCRSMVLVEPPPDYSAVSMPVAPPVAPAEPPQTSAPQGSDDVKLDATPAAAATVTAKEVPQAVSATAEPEPPSPPPAPSSDDEPAMAAAAAIPLVMPAAPPAAWQKWLVYGASGTAGAMFVVSAWLFWKSRDVQMTAAPPPSPATSVAEPAPPSNPPLLKREGDAQPNSSPTVTSQPKDSRAPDSSVNPAHAPPAPPNQLVATENDEKEGDVVAAPAPHLDAIDAPANTDPLLIAEADEASNVPNKHESPPTPKAPGELPFGPGPPVEYPIPDAHPDVAARLAMHIAAIELTGDKANGEVLTHVTTMLSQMTAVPIRLDTVALKQIGKNGDTPVRLKMANVTVAELLDAMLGAWGLAAVATGDHVLVTVPQNGAATKSYEQRYPFDDLAANEAELRDMADLIRRMVAPATWSSGDGDAKISINGADLQITQSPTAHHEILLLSEKLRVARGLQPKSVYFRSDPASLPLDSRSMLAASKLAASGNFSTSEQVPLTGYASSLQYRSGIEVAVDELALYRAGLSPEILVGYDGPEKSLAEVLAEVLGPVNLAYRIIDATTVQITTPKVLAETPEIEFFPIAAMPAGGAEALLARIEADVAPAYWKSAGDEAHPHFDARSRCLLVRAAQPVQQQLQAALIDWGVAEQPAN